MHHRQLHSERGSAITAAAVSSSILAIVVAGLLTYMANEARLNFRSHDWTQSLHLAEAAIETGLAEYTYQYTAGGTGFQSSRGWSGGSGTYVKTIAVTNALNQVVGAAQVTVSNVGGSTPQIDGVGTITTAGFGGSVARAVRVKLANSSKYPVGIMSKSTINLNGNNMYADSFDSTDPAKSTGGQYDATKKQPNGNVATNSELINSLNIGNADIYGYAYTGPSGTVTMGPNGSVGPTFVSGDRATTVAAGTANGWIRNDFDVDVPDATLPTGLAGAPTVPGGTINNNMTIAGGDWQASSISLAANRTLTITGTVRLYVTGNTSITGNGRISISPGARLEVYCGGSISLAGNGVVNNNRAEDNQWHGLSTCASASIAGNGSFVGTLYAPNAALSVGGNGEVQGAVVANSITFSGNANLHYDESLQNVTGSTGYTVVSWQELRQSGTTWVP